MTTLQPTCPRCRHRHRPDLRCWKGPYAAAISRAVLVDDPPCWLRYPGCTLRATEPDHIIPRARGGTDDPDNLRPACAHCNRARAHAAPFPIPAERPPAGVALSPRWTD